jgi:Kinesin motor domain.
LLQQTPGRRFRITVSFIEIHDDEVRDLLNTSQFKKRLIIIDDLKVSIRNL